MRAFPDPDGFPAPVATPLKSFRDAATTADRITTGADAGYAIVKYVALVRLADWIREGMQRASQVESLEEFNRSLWGGSTEHWWKLASALEADAVDPVAPAMPRWSDPGLQVHMQTVNRARHSHHSGAAQQPDLLFAEDVDEAVRCLLEAAAPLFAGVMARRQGDRVEPCMGASLPPDDPGSWDVVWQSADGREMRLEPFALVVSPDEGIQTDLYVYERLTQRGYIFQRNRTQVEIGQRLPILDRLRFWLRERMEIQRRQGGRLLEQLDPEALRNSLDDGLERHLQKEWRIASAMKNPAERPEVERATGRLARSGVGFLCLTGPSGIGKTFELARWMYGQAGDVDRRVRLWIRASSWMGESFDVLAGTQANGGEPATLSLEHLRTAASGRGLAIAIDGLNEAKDPEGLVGLVVGAVKQLAADGKVPVQLLVTSRPEVVDRVLRGIDSSWRTAVDLGKEGVMALRPLPSSAARRLWDSSAQSTRMPRFDALPATVQRLLRVPILSALARDARFEGNELLDAEGIIERFVATQTSSYQRVLLRHFAVRMFERGGQTLNLGDFESADDATESVRRAIRGEEGAWGEAFLDLVSQGLLVQHGSFPVGEDSGLSFAHDRILQWFVGRWLARTRPEVILQGRLSALVDQVLASTALSAAVGEAFARVHRTAPPETRQLMERELLASLVRGSTSDSAVRELVAARHAVRAWAESDPATLDRWMNRAWQRCRFQPAARIELVSIAADVDHVAVLAHGLGSWKSVREATVAVLSRVRLHNPEVVRAALERRWKEIRYPLLHPIDTVTVLIALLYGSVAEGGLAEPDEKLSGMARTLTLDLLGDGTGWFARLLKNLVVRILIGGLNPFLDFFPQGPINQTAELRAFLKQVKQSDRACYLPLIRLFAGEVHPADVRDIALKVAVEGPWLPTVLLERGLMVASERPGEGEEALDLAVEVGRAAQAASRFVPMAAEGMLYVLSEYLRHNVNLPTPEAWDRRFAQFQELARGWLECAKDRRWYSPFTKRKYKALYATAYAILWQIRYGDEPCPVIRDLWEESFKQPDKEQARKLALDLVDDLEILALNEGSWGRALLELEPFLERQDAPEPVLKKVAQLLGAIGERDPAAVSARLDPKLPGRNRVLVSRRMHMGRPRATLGNAFYQGFDRGLVLNPRFRGTVRAIMENLLESPSRRAWFEFAVRRVACDLTGRQIFGG